MNPYVDTVILNIKIIYIRKSGRMKKCEVGGQAVIEGVMMRGSKGQATAIRKPDGKIEIDMKKIIPITKRYKFLNIPFIRGIFVLIDSLVTGINTLK